MVIDSLDAILTSIQANGSLNRLWTGGSTGVLATASIDPAAAVFRALRHPITWTMPAVGAGLSGMFLTTCHINAPGGAGTMMLGLEYLLGSLTVSGNVFAGGVAMPIKPVFGDMIQTSSMLTFASVRTALTATTPTLSFTYVDQDGGTLNNGSLILPTNASANSAYLLNNYLAAGDTGVRQINALSISAGSAGAIDVYGFLPIQELICDTTTSRMGSPSPLAQPRPQWLIEPAEVLTMYCMEWGATNNLFMVHMTGVAQAA